MAPLSHFSTDPPAHALSSLPRQSQDLILPYSAHNVYRMTLVQCTQVRDPDGHGGYGLQQKPGETALHVTSEEGHLEVVRLLLDALADKDKADEDGYTALLATQKRPRLSDWCWRQGLPR